MFSFGDITDYLKGNITGYVSSYFGLTSLKSSVLFIILPIIWYSLGLISIVTVRKYMFNAGYFISQRCKKVPYWDKYAEPIFIRQLTLFFTASHSLIEGMISDNDNKEEIKKDLAEMKDGIMEDLEAYKELEDSEENKDKKIQLKEKINGKLNNIICKLGFKK